MCIRDSCNILYSFCKYIKLAKKSKYLLLNSYYFVNLLLYFLKQQHNDTSSPVSYTHLDVYKRQITANSFLNGTICSAMHSTSGKLTKSIVERTIFTPFPS